MHKFHVIVSHFLALSLSGLETKRLDGISGNPVCVGSESCIDSLCMDNHVALSYSDAARLTASSVSRETQDQI